jgi:hypothetical protein
MCDISRRLAGQRTRHYCQQSGYEYLSRNHSVIPPCACVLFIVTAVYKYLAIKKASSRISVNSDLDMIVVPVLAELPLRGVAVPV